MAEKKMYNRFIGFRESTLRNIGDDVQPLRESLLHKDFPKQVPDDSLWEKRVQYLEKVAAHLFAEHFDLANQLKTGDEVSPEHIEIATKGLPTVDSFLYRSQSEKFKIEPLLTGGGIVQNKDELDKDFFKRALSDSGVTTKYTSSDLEEFSKWLHANYHENNDGFGARIEVDLVRAYEEIKQGVTSRTFVLKCMASDLQNIVTEHHGFYKNSIQELKKYLEKQTPSPSPTGRPPNIPLQDGNQNNSTTQGSGRGRS